MSKDVWVRIPPGAPIDILISKEVYMIVVDKVTVYIPKSLCFSLEEVRLILQLLDIKKNFSTEKELPLVESLIKGFKSLKIDLEEDERHEAGFA